MAMHRAFADTSGDEMMANDNQPQQKMESDLEVSLFYPGRRDYFSGSREVLKEDLSVEGATAHAREYASSHPEMDYDSPDNQKPSRAMGKIHKADVHRRGGVRRAGSERQPWQKDRSHIQGRNKV